MHVYDLAGYGSMANDAVRIAAYECAIRQVVEPGSIVVDLGTGSGILALLACRYGAGKVFAVEPGAIIQLARELARANGCEDRIEFIERRSTEVTLPTRADVIVSDMHGVLPLFQGHIPTLVDARRRLLAPGGRLIPQRDTIWAAVVDAPGQYGRLVGPWARRYGLDMSAGRRYATNCWCKCRVECGQLMVEPQRWATLEYESIESPDLRGALTWKARRAGTVHGIVLWFDAALAEGAHFSNAPGAPEMIFGQAFFPLAEPVALAVGDQVSVDLQARLVNGDYVWVWNTCIRDEASPSSVKASFRQSTFLGVIRSVDQLKKWRASV